MNETVAKEYQEYKEQDRIWGLIDPERITAIKFPRIDKAIIEAFLEIEDVTSTVSDVLDSMGICGAVPASLIGPVIPGKRVAGTAVTLRNIPERNSVYKNFTDHNTIRMTTRDIQYMAEPGDILVIDGGGRTDISNIGGQSCLVTKTCGLAASVVYGAVRDIGSIREMDHPTWAMGGTPITGKFRIEAIQINGPVTFGPIQILPGDLIIADDSGIVAIPADKAEEVLKAVQETTEMERKMEDLIKSGASFQELKELHRQRYK